MRSILNKPLIFSLFVFLSFQKTNGQTNLSWVESKQLEIVLPAVADDQNIYWVGFDKSKNVFFAKHDHTNKVIVSSLIDIPFKNKKNIFYEAPLLCDQNNVSLIYAHYQNSAKVIEVKAAIISKTNGTLNEVKQVFNIPGTLKQHVDSRFFLNVRLSSDKSKVLVYYDDLPKKNELKSVFHVFDNNLNLLWTNEQTEPVEGNASVKNYVVSNDGSVYLYVKFELGREEKTDEQHHRHVIYSYDNKGGKLAPYTLALDSGYVSEMDIAADADDNLICSGLVTEKEKRLDRASFAAAFKDYGKVGSFFAKVEKGTNKTLVKRTDYFSENDTIGGSTGKQLSKAIQEFYPRTLQLENGNVLMIAEYYQFYKVKQGESTIYNEDYGGLVIVKYTRAGEKVWHYSLRKGWTLPFFSKNKYGYALGITDDHLIFVYNQNLKGNKPAKEDIRYTDIFLERVNLSNGVLLGVERLVKPGDKTSPNIIEQMNSGQTGKKLMTFSGTPTFSGSPILPVSFGVLRLD